MPSRQTVALCSKIASIHMDLEYIYRPIGRGKIFVAVFRDIAVPVCSIIFSNPYGIMHENDSQTFRTFVIRYSLVFLLNLSCGSSREWRHRDKLHVYSCDSIGRSIIPPCPSLGLGSGFRHFLFINWSSLVRHCTCTIECRLAHLVRMSDQCALVWVNR